MNKEEYRKIVVQFVENNIAPKYNIITDNIIDKIIAEYSYSDFYRNSSIEILHYLEYKKYIA
jgi:hypothetical protein